MADASYRPSAKSENPWRKSGSDRSAAAEAAALVDELTGAGGRAVAVRADCGDDAAVRGAVAAYYRSQFLNLTLPGGVAGDVHRAVRHGREIGRIRLDHQAREPLRLRRGAHRLGAGDRAGHGVRRGPSDGAPGHLLGQVRAHLPQIIDVIRAPILLALGEQKFVMHIRSVEGEA